MRNSFSAAATATPNMATWEMSEGATKTASPVSMPIVASPKPGTLYGQGKVNEIGAIIEAVSACVPLDPGDLIATGAMVTEEFAPQVLVQVGDTLVDCDRLLKFLYLGVGYIHADHA